MSTYLVVSQSTFECRDSASTPYLVVNDKKLQLTTETNTDGRLFITNSSKTYMVIESSGATTSWNTTIATTTEAYRGTTTTFLSDCNYTYLGTINAHAMYERGRNGNKQLFTGYGFALNTFFDSTSSYQIESRINENQFVNNTREMYNNNSTITTSLHSSIIAFGAAHDTDPSNTYTSSVNPNDRNNKIAVTLSDSKYAEWKYISYVSSSSTTYMHAKTSTVQTSFSGSTYIYEGTMYDVVPQTTYTYSSESNNHFSSFGTFDVTADTSQSTQYTSSETYQYSASIMKDGYASTSSSVQMFEKSVEGIVSKSMKNSGNLYTIYFSLPLSVFSTNVISETNYMSASLTQNASSSTVRNSYFYAAGNSSLKSVGFLRARDTTGKFSMSLTNDDYATFAYSTSISMSASTYYEKFTGNLTKHNTVTSTSYSTTSAEGYEIPIAYSTTGYITSTRYA